MIKDASGFIMMFVNNGLQSAGCTGKIATLINGEHDAVRQRWCHKIMLFVRQHMHIGTFVGRTQCVVALIGTWSNALHGVAVPHTEKIFVKYITNAQRHPPVAQARIHFATHLNVYCRKGLFTNFGHTVVKRLFVLCPLLLSREVGLGECQSINQFDCLAVIVDGHIAFWWCHFKPLISSDKLFGWL